MFRSFLAAFLLVLTFALPVHAEGGVHIHAHPVPTSIGPCPRCPAMTADPVTVILVDNLTAPVSAQAPLSQLTRTAQALQDWANSQLAPVWGLSPITVTVLPRGAHYPAKRMHQWLLHLVNTSDVYGALGYHTVSPNDIPWGEVAVGDSIQDGGNWTVCASHELAEMLVDPMTNRVALGAAHQNPDEDPEATPPTVTYNAWITEVGDPVQDRSYLFGDRGHVYRFTDFAYPSEFSPTGLFPFDRLHVLKAPFTTTRGGYSTPFTVTRQPTPLIDRS